MSHPVPQPRVPADPRGLTAPILLSLALAGACAESNPSEARVSRADSAGVEIVVSSLPAWSPETAPVVVAEPRLRIGSRDGPEETLLSSVRFATVLSDGRIVIANGGSSELRFFGRDGRFEFAVGGPGEGPGEFTSLYPSFTRLPGDTLRVFDGAIRRITEFTGSGAFVRSRTLDPPDLGDFGVLYAGTFRDGRLAVSTTSLPPARELSDGTVVRGERTYWTLEAVDGTAVEIDRLVEPERMARVTGGNLGIVPLPFRFSDQAVAHANLVVASTDRHQVRWYTPDGVLLRIARWEGGNRELTPERYEEWLNGLELPPERVEAIRERNEGLPLPSTVPTAQSLLVDPAGNAWIEPFRLAPSEPNLWTVIAGDGTWLGRVELPSRLEPYEIGEDYVIGLWRDELDVSYVHLHDLNRTPAAL